jgi:hypothetical protein
MQHPIEWRMDGRNDSSANILSSFPSSPRKASSKVLILPDISGQTFHYIKQFPDL